MSFIFDEVGHCKGTLRESKVKLRNAWHARHEHENRKKPCEKCALAEESGFGKEWHCDYYHTVLNRIEKFQGEVSRDKAALRAAIKRKEKADDEDNR